MPPTIQNGTNVPEKTRPVKPVEKKSDLICKVKYCNTLPDIPFDLKFISYPFESTRFIQFNPTSLERNYRYDVLTEHDLGVGIDLINKDIYAVDHGAMLDPADEKLLEEDILTPQDSKRSRHHATSVSWLRRTEYISTEQTRFQPQTMDKVEAKVGYSIKKNLGNETMYMDRDSQIKAIEKTFEDTLRQPIEKHYSKPNVYATEVLPLFPDFSLWKFPCAQVIFDSDPAPVGKQMPAQIEEMSQAMIRGVMDESGEQFVAYFLPTEETLAKRREDFVQQIPYQDDVEYEYKMAREYNWNVKSKASKGYEENYFFVIRQDGAYYNELETRVRLSKRRQKTGAGAAGERQPQTTSNTRLVVKHRPMEANEFRMQRYREKQLEPNADEDDEMEMEQDEEEEEEEDQQQQQQQQQDQDQEQEDNNNEDNESNKSGGGGSRSSSRSRSRSRSKSRSKSSAGSSRSRSRSRSKSGSEADKEEEGEEREGSEKGSDNEGGGGSDAEEGSPARSRSRSRSKSRSQSRSRSGSKSPASNRSRSGSRSKSRSKSRSRSKSKSRSRSGSPATSRASGARSRSGSPDAEEEEQNGGGGGGGSGNEESENDGGGSGSEGGNNKSDSE